MSDIKGKPRYLSTRQEKIIKKQIENHMNYFERFPPFKYPRGFWMRLLYLFSDFKICRRLMGGTFIRNPEGPFKMWLWANEENFKPEMFDWAEKEVWK